MYLFKCSCSLTTRAVGDGCQKCNTVLAIDQMLTPVEVSEELISNAYFTDDQASYIASEVYQPLLSLVETLNLKIDELASVIESK